MSLKILELFGYAPDDNSDVAQAARRHTRCPFIGATCTKQFRDGVKAGACTVKLAKSGPVICCPNRLYAQEYLILQDVATQAFGDGTSLVRSAEGELPEKPVLVFGKRWGKELRLPSRGGRGSFFVDWILALLNDDGSLAEFVALEVQTIDTTGTYRGQYDSYMSGDTAPATSKAGLNWENVNKRILPQLIYKGHVLRREPLCTKGLFFVCPTQIKLRVEERLGGELLAYDLQPGSLTFRAYDLGDEVEAGQTRSIIHTTQTTTTVDQVAVAFTSPRDLPPPRVYEEAIRQGLA